MLCSLLLGELYMVVEYCCHGNLRCFLKKHRPIMQANSVIMKNITLYDLTSFCLQVAKGMNYLASKKVIFLFFLLNLFYILGFKCHYKL